jgi:hypothetical protein
MLDAATKSVANSTLWAMAKVVTHTMTAAVSIASVKVFSRNAQSIHTSMVSLAKRVKIAKASVVGRYLLAFQACVMPN